MCEEGAATAVPAAYDGATKPACTSSEKESLELSHKIQRTRTYWYTLKPYGLDQLHSKGPIFPALRRTEYNWRELRKGSGGVEE